MDWKTYSIAPWKHVRTPRLTFSPRVGELDDEHVLEDEGRTDPTRIRRRQPSEREEASYRRQRTRTRRRGAPGEGERGGTLAAAEHAYSTPKSKWSAESEKNALSTDAPEGVVGENKEEVRVQPFSCSGASSGKSTHRRLTRPRGI